MPKPNQSGRKRFFYNQNIKRVKSGDKYKNLIDHTITLAKRLEKEGMTKWMANAFNKAQAKIKSYGVTFAQVASALDHKGLSSLKDIISTHFVFVQRKGQNVSISKKRDVIAKTSPIIGEGKAPAKKTPVKAKVEKAVPAKKETKATAPKKEVVKKAPVKKTTATTEKKTPTKKDSIAKKTPIKKVA